MWWCKYSWSSRRWLYHVVPCVCLWCESVGMSASVCVWVCVCWCAFMMFFFLFGSVSLLLFVIVIFNVMYVSCWDLMLFVFHYLVHWFPIHSVYWLIFSMTRAAVWTAMLLHAFCCALTMSLRTWLCDSKHFLIVHRVLHPTWLSTLQQRCFVHEDVLA